MQKNDSRIFFLNYAHIRIHKTSSGSLNCREITHLCSIVENLNIMRDEIIRLPNESNVISPILDVYDSIKILLKYADKK
jgi:hypothetical protein